MMSSLLRVAVLAGGDSDEREISLKSGMAVEAALSQIGHRVLQLDPAIARRLMGHLRAAPRDDPAARMTARELEVLRVVGAGKANKEIAAELGISERTARTHVSNILSKLGLHSRTQAALWAVREGLVEADRRGDAADAGRQS